MVTVDSAGTIKHDRCLGTAGAVEAARKVPPIKPLQAKEIKQTRQALKAEKVVPPAGATVEQAVKRHEELMVFAKPMGKTGESKSGGDTWKARYEPIKKGTWLNTRHQVVLRWKGSGHAPSFPFKFSELTMNNDAFQPILETAMGEIVRIATE